MEMKENSQKKVLLSVLGVAILVVAVIGISFAAYSTVFTSDANTVTTGTVMVSYNEPSNAILVEDAMPMSDADGKAQTNRGKFDFTVSTKADNALRVPYEISLTKVELACTSTEPKTPEGCFDSMADNQVKAYLEKENAYVAETGENGTLISALGATNIRPAAQGAKLLHAETDTFTTTGEAAKTTNYTLRLWIDKAVDYDAVSGKEYHAKVNVDSHVDPITTAQP